MEELKNIFDRRSFFRTRSPKKYKEELSTEAKCRERVDFDGSIVVFDDVLDHNQKLFHLFWAIGRHKNLDIECLSQYLFHLP